jgi:hypothetical protein
MTIPRPLFLVAASALAAAACQVYVGSDPPKTTATAAAPAPTAHPPAPTNPAWRPPAQGGAATTTPAPVRPVPVHLAHIGAGGTASPAPSAGGSTPSPAPSSGCLDASAAAVPACSSLPAADSSCSSNAVPQQKCAAYAAYFDPKVAAAAISCMASLSSKQLCDATQAAGCAHTALAQACPDSTVSQLCGIAATSCHTSAGDCTSLLSGLNDQGKQQVAQCVAQGCSAGLQACIDALAVH